MARPPQFERQDDFQPNLATLKDMCARRPQSARTCWHGFYSTSMIGASYFRLRYEGGVNESGSTTSSTGWPRSRA